LGFQFTVAIGVRTHLRKTKAVNLSIVELVPATISGLDGIVMVEETALTA
jgi:hypothetical protein